jgi:hypothetical protein
MRWLARFSRARFGFLTGSDRQDRQHNMLSKVVDPPRTCSRASQMTAAAVAATAAVTVTAVTAAAAASPTRYERTLANCARDLSDFAGCTEPGAFWDEERFRLPNCWTNNARGSILVARGQGPLPLK